MEFLKCHTFHLDRVTVGDLWSALKSKEISLVQFYMALYQSEKFLINYENLPKILSMKDCLKFFI